MFKKNQALKIIEFAMVIALLSLLIFGYKLSYKKDIEKIDSKTINF